MATSLLNLNSKMSVNYEPLPALTIELHWIESSSSDPISYEPLMVVQTFTDKSAKCGKEKMRVGTELNTPGGEPVSASQNWNK